jgi:hypothetical protein
VNIATPQARASTGAPARVPRPAAAAEQPAIQTTAHRPQRGRVAERRLGRGGREASPRHRVDARDPVGQALRRAR